MRVILNCDKIAFSPDARHLWSGAAAPRLLANRPHNAMSALRLSPAFPLALSDLPCPVGLSAAQRPVLHRMARLVAIAGAHLLLAWALLQTHSVRQVLHEARPLVVALLADVQPTPPVPVLPAPAPARPLPAPAWLPPPEITVAAAPAAPVPVTVVVATAPAAPVAAPQPATAASPLPVAAPRPPAPPPVAVPAEPRQVAAGQIRYRVAPAVEVPMASRRLGESGTVWLKVVVDVNGLPRQVSLHRSSGHARLDEQALAAMRSARFQPLVEGGSAYEWLVIAPLQYDID